MAWDKKLEHNLKPERLVLASSADRSNLKSGEPIMGDSAVVANIQPQLTFDWGRPNLINFETFCEAPEKGMVHHLKTILHRPDRLVYIWGQKGAGRTHLLQATCHLAGVRRRSAIYLPLSDVLTESKLPPMAVLENLDHLDVVCIDEIDQLAQRLDWQEAVFHLFNECVASNTAMVFSALVPPTQLPIDLLDLKSRLGSCVVYRIDQLSDDQKMECLKKRAGMLGLDMNNAIADFLMQHGSRNLADLMEMVEILDRGSMAAKRKLTIPFVKSVFGW